MKFSTLKRQRQRGFSLVELMVAVVIGLIGTVVMFQVFAVSESQKRSTTSGSDAQQNGAIALFTLERDLRNTGHGINELVKLGRPIYTWSGVNNAVLNPSVFRPILITPGTGFDSIELTYSTSEGLSSPLIMMDNWNPTIAPNPNVSVVRVEGIQLGDHIAICPNASANAAEVCVRGEVTATSIVAPGGATSAGSYISLLASPGTYVVDNVVITPRFNPPVGFSAAMTARVASDGGVMPAIYPGTGDSNTSGNVFVLGQLVTRTYSIQNNQLVLNDGAVTTEFANNIVGMRAQYGLDTNNDGSVDAWVDPRSVQVNPRASYTPNHASFLVGTDAQIATSWRMVKAARVAVVARSDNMEKDVVETRSTIPLWTNSNGNPAPSFSVPSGDGTHFRYRVFETIVPFRNMIWGSQL